MGNSLSLSAGDLITHGPRSTLPTANRIKNLSIWMKGEEAGRADLGRQFDGGELAVVRVESGVVVIFFNCLLEELAGNGVQFKRFRLWNS